MAGRPERQPARTPPHQGPTAWRRIENNVFRRPSIYRPRPATITAGTLLSATLTADAHHEDNLHDHLTTDNHSYDVRELQHCFIAPQRLVQVDACEMVGDPIRVDVEAVAATCAITLEYDIEG
jgi:hypothetical protein